MKCPLCNGEEFQEKQAVVGQVFFDEIMEILTSVTRCKVCGWQCLNDDQIDQLSRRTRETYLLRTEVGHIRHEANEQARLWKTKGPAFQ